MKTQLHPKSHIESFGGLVLPVSPVADDPVERGVGMKSNLNHETNPPQSCKPMQALNGPKRKLARLLDSKYGRSDENCERDIGSKASNQGVDPSL